MVEEAVDASQQGKQVDIHPFTITFSKRNVEDSQKMSFFHLRETENCVYSGCFLTDGDTLSDASTLTRLQTAACCCGN